MGIWDEQNYLSLEHGKKLKAELDVLVREVQEIDIKISDLRTRGVKRYSDTYTALVKKKFEVQSRLSETRKALKHANVEAQQERLREAGIDATDPRELLALALSDINRLKRKLAARGYQFDDPKDTDDIRDAISLYLQYRARAPQGKLAFVPAQVEHRGRVS